MIQHIPTLHKQQLLRANHLTHGVIDRMSIVASAQTTNSFFNVKQKQILNVGRAGNCLPVRCKSTHHTRT